MQVLGQLDSYGAGAAAGCRQRGSPALIIGACASLACAGRLGRQSRWKHTCAAR